jgi:PAS domain S-box-containing protein
MRDPFSINAAQVPDSKMPSEMEMIRVLHVDDDASFLQVSKQILMSIDSVFEVDCAYSVDDAFLRLSNKEYDVIVSDYDMPYKNGLDFLKQLNKQKIDRSFILFTGKGREEVAVQALNLGADGYFSKYGSVETVYGELAHGIKMVTQKRKAEQSLKSREEQLEAIVSNAPIGIAVSDSNKYFLSANEEFCRILGFSEEELKKMTFEDVTHVEDLQESRANVEKLACKRASFFTQEKRYVKKDGTTIYGKVTVKAVNGKQNKPAIFVVELEDITEKKKSTVELENKYELLEKVTESLDAGLAIVSKDYQVVWANKILRDLGVAPNKKCYQTFNNLESVCPDCGVRKILEENVNYDVHEFKSVNSKGKNIWVELRVTPIRDKHGNVASALELAVPITRSREKEKKYNRWLR